MDQVDLRILKIIQDEPRIPQARLGRKVGLSTSTVNERLKKLNLLGIIKRYAVVLDPGRLGLGLSAFIQVLLERPADEKALANGIKKILNDPERAKQMGQRGREYCLQFSLEAMIEKLDNLYSSLISSRMMNDRQ